MQIRQLTDDTEKQRVTRSDTVELYVMGVLPQLHRRGVGRELLNRALGFKEFEVFPTLWDPGNPCQIYVLYLQ